MELRGKKWGVTMMAALIMLLGSAMAPAMGETVMDVPMVNLPADELPHPKTQAEWWYYSGHLEDEQGRKYGIMASFFIARMGNMPASHFMISALTEKTDKKFHSESIIQKEMIDMMEMLLKNPPESMKEFIDPDGLDIEQIKKHHKIMKHKPKVKKDQLAIKYDDTYFRKSKEGGRDVKTWEYRTKITGDDYAVELTMTPTRRPMYVGGVGNVGMSDGEDMFYYSITRLEAEGTITIDGEERRVTGTTWYDHQYGSMGGPDKPVGWDWICLQLDNGTDINLSVIRDLRDNGRRYNRLATVQRGDGRVSVVRDVTIEMLDEWTSPGTGITYPLGWRLAIPSLGATFTVLPDVQAQEMYTFGPYAAIWEGSCTVEGVIEGETVKGNAYTELTGYSYQK